MGSEGAGSGSVLDHDGHILTNYHVIEGAQEIRVTLSSGETYNAGLIGADPVLDTAVLRINAPREVLFPIEFGDSSALRVGQKVFAIGNPFGLERTMTVGIISSLNRSLQSKTGRAMKSIIQIDAALNQGNSGGPLLNSRGRLIGMNTAIASRTGENTGVGFSIPVNSIHRVVPQLIENGRVIRPDVGISRVYQTEHGLIIATLAPDGPAEGAGLRGFRVIRERQRQGMFVYEETRIDRDYADLIVAVDGVRVRTADELLSAIERKKPGDEVTLSVIRDGAPLNVSVVLGAGE
jgi:S1-C subfamily serine protease